MMSSFLNNLYDRLYDFKLGIRTDGVHESEAASRFGDDVECCPTPYRVLGKIFRQLSICKDDVFVDFGCGKGRAVCFATLFPFRKIYGVEISEKWHAAAEFNVNKLRREGVKVLNINALDFSGDDVTVYYFFNPFGEKTFSGVVKNILSSLEKNKRAVKLIYFNPLHADLLEETGVFNKTRDLHLDRNGNPVVLLYENLY